MQKPDYISRREPKKERNWPARKFGRCGIAQKISLNAARKEARRRKDGLLLQSKQASRHTIARSRRRKSAERNVTLFEVFKLWANWQTTRDQTVTCRPRLAHSNLLVTMRTARLAGLSSCLAPPSPLLAPLYWNRWLGEKEIHESQ